MNKLAPLLLLLSLSALGQDTCQEPPPECLQLCEYLQWAQLGVAQVHLFGWITGTIDAADCRMDAACYHTATECTLAYRGIDYRIHTGPICLHCPACCLGQRAQCLMDNPVDWTEHGWDGDYPCY